MGKFTKEVQSNLEKVMKMIYGKASNRLNELSNDGVGTLPLAKREFDSLINSIASWKNCYSCKMEDKLVKDLKKLRKKWERKAQAMLE